MHVVEGQDFTRCVDTHCSACRGGTLDFTRCASTHCSACPIKDIAHCKEMKVHKVGEYMF